MIRLENWLRHGGASMMLEGLLVVLLGVALAYWTWAVIAPRTVAVSLLSAPDADHRVATSLAKRNLFGEANQGKPAAIAEAPSSMKLLGVIARGSKGQGRAILSLESGKVREVEAGWQISPGLVLKEVYSDHVIIARNGVAERIRLGRRAASVR